MKIIISQFLLLTSLQCVAQVCLPNHISTNPDSPSNASAPSVQFVNDFNWFQQELNSQLLDLQLLDMVDYYPVSAMLNPYNPENVLCSYLSSANLADLDIYPEDGWELLFFNLGEYPDGTAYSTQNSNIPYIILYNKYRSILRLFANAKFLQQNFEEVEVILEFNSGSLLTVSGLFRQNGGLDKSLDQETEVSSLRTFAILPNDHNQWFHADFQVSYDPCTCLYDSRLQLQFTPINSNEIKLENEDFPLSEIDLQDNEGLNLATAIIPITPRMITFHSMVENIEYARVLAEKYIERSELNGFNVDWLNSNYSSLALLETIAHAETNIISSSEISAAAQYAEDLRSQWGLQTNGNSSDFVNDVWSSWGILPSDCYAYDPTESDFTVNLNKLMTFCTQNLSSAQSLSLSAIEENSVGNNVKITPSASFISTDLELTIGSINSGEISTIELLNPGTYPIQENDNTFTGPTAQNYPVYNEILGLFAVLEQPKLDIFHTFEIDVLASPNR